MSRFILMDDGQIVHDPEITSRLSCGNVLASVKAATTCNINFSAVPLIDGILLSRGDRVLIKNQDDPSENGIYVVDSGPCHWKRAKDAHIVDLAKGTCTFVESGDENQNSLWVRMNDTSRFNIKTEKTPVVFGRVHN